MLWFLEHVKEPLNIMFEITFPYKNSMYIKIPKIMIERHSLAIRRPIANAIFGLRETPSLVCFQEPIQAGSLKHASTAHI